LAGLTRLPDDLYRLVIKAKIAANFWDGTIPGAYAVYDAVFASLGVKTIIQDNQDMSMYVGVIGLADTPINLALLRLGYIFSKPEGVRITGYIYAEDPGAKLLAWDAQSDRLGGWDEAVWGKEVAGAAE
jgi:hypothetical protein